MMQLFFQLQLQRWGFCACLDSYIANHVFEVRDLVGKLYPFVEEGFLVDVLENWTHFKIDVINSPEGVIVAFLVVLFELIDLLVQFGEPGLCFPQNFIVLFL